MSDINVIHNYCEEHVFSLGKPDQQKENVLIIPIHFTSKLLVFQTPKLEVRSPEGSGEVHLLFQRDELSNSNHKKMKQFYSYIQSFEDNIISKLQTHLNSLFKNQDINANELFKSSIHHPKSLDSPCYMSVGTSPGYHLFDHTGQKLQVDNFGIENQRAIFILSCESITITPIQAYVNWKIEQVQLQKIKHKKISSKIKDFRITPEHEPEAAEGGDTITISLNELKS